MRNTPESIALDAAIEATFAISRPEYGAPDYILAAAQHARRNILDGITPRSEYAAVAAYFNGAADALMAARFKAMAEAADAAGRGAEALRYWKLADDARRTADRVKGAIK